MRSRNEATKEAKIAVKKLGRGWKYRVWNNVGWHASCYRGPVSVHVEPGYYHAMVSDQPNDASFGCNEWSTMHPSISSNPRTAVRRAIGLVAAVVRRYNRVLDICNEIEENFIDA